MLMILQIIESEGAIGRYRLCRMLDLPEGIVRGHLSRLSKGMLLKATRKGCKLTEKGMSVLKSLLDKHGIIAIKDYDAGPLSISNKHVIVHLRRKLPDCSILDLRDEAVRVGAKGVVLIEFSKHGLSVPRVYPDLKVIYPDFAEQILQSFDLKIGDTLILGGAEDKWKALKGALAVALKISACKSH